MAEIGSEVRELEIPRLIGDADRALEKLNKDVEDMRDRLSTVLNPASTPKEEDNVNKEPFTQVGENIQSLMRKISHIHDMVWDINSRLEV